MQLGGKACSDMYRGTGAEPSFARPGPFDFAQGRLSEGARPTTSRPHTSLIFSIPLSGLAIYLG